MMKAAVALAVLVLAAPAAARAQISDFEREAWTRFDIWVQAIESHRPGENDAAVRAMLIVSARDLEAVFPFMVFALRAAEPDNRRMRFDDLFRRYGVNKSKPQDHARIAASGRRVARGGVDAFLKRAAMLHADIGMMFPDGHRTRSAGLGHVVNDGRGVGDDGRPWHWMLGRSFLHLVENAEADPFVRLWYQAVGNRMLAIRDFTESEPHMERAVDLFPRDAEINFLRGWAHDAQASPIIQAAVAERIARMREQERVKYVSAIKSVEAEQERAIAAYRRAIEADGSHLDARIRLGRLLAIDGKAAEAVEHLRAALDASTDPVRKYLTQLFLGRAFEVLRQPDQAREAYAAARELLPQAQAPRLALSQLAMNAGDRAAALEALAFMEKAGDFDDPWWMFQYSRDPDASVWFGRLRALAPGEIR